jgi:TPR repeat protein
MPDNSELRHMPKQSGTALALSETRASLIARARKDTAIILMGRTALSLPSVAANGDQPSVTEPTDADEQFELGRKYFRGQGVQEDYAQAALWLRKAADQGHAVAQQAVGTLFEKGQGVEQDYAQADYWYRKAASQNDALAQYCLGLLYTHDHGVGADYSQAAAWYRRAAEQGNQNAQWQLGNLYRDGLGVSADYSEAYFWWYLSFYRSVRPEQTRFVNAHEKAKGGLTVTQVAEAQQRAHVWLAAHQQKETVENGALPSGIPGART